MYTYIYICTYIYTHTHIIFSIIYISSIAAATLIHLKKSLFPFAFHINYCSTNRNIKCILAKHFLLGLTHYINSKTLRFSPCEYDKDVKRIIMLMIIIYTHNDIFCFVQKKHQYIFLKIKCFCIMYIIHSNIYINWCVISLLNLSCISLIKTSFQPFGNINLFINSPLFFFFILSKFPFISILRVLY